MTRRWGVSSVPLRQGALDGMCGVYSVVNAIYLRTPRRLSALDYRVIFKALCQKLENDGRLADVLTGGMSVQVLGKLIDSASAHTEENHGFTIQRRLAYRTDPENLDTFWQKLKLHLEKEGSGGAIIRTSGRHDHWTCVRAMSKRSIQLADSDGLSRLLRSRCTIFDPTTVRQHCLCPTQAYFLSVEIL